MSKKSQCDGELVFRRYRKDPRSGKILDAYKYGFKAWPICLGTMAKEKAAPTGTA